MLTPQELGKLKSLEHAVGYQSVECARLEMLGFVETGRSRFADWARITASGKEFLSVLPPVSGDGAGPSAGYSYRGAEPRIRRDSANQARGSAAITPPAAALDVGALSQIHVIHIVRRVTEMVLDYGSTRNKGTGDHAS